MITKHYTLLPVRWHFHTCRLLTRYENLEHGISSYRKVSDIPYVQFSSARTSYAQVSVHHCYCIQFKRTNQYFCKFINIANFPFVWKKLPKKYVLTIWIIILLKILYHKPSTHLYTAQNTSHVHILRAKWNNSHAALSRQSIT